MVARRIGSPLHAWRLLAPPKRSVEALSLVGCSSDPHGARRARSMTILAKLKFQSDRGLLPYSQGEDAWSMIGAFL
jgi:hypothetical protein